MSIITIGAIAVYGTVVLTCLCAANVARKFPDRPNDKFHWVAAGLVFVGLIIMRLINGEERLRNIARETIKATGGYSERTDLQLPLAIAALILSFVVIWVFARKWQATRPGSRANLVLVARFGLFGLVALYVLRLISLHITDQLLYTGPVRLNWLLEMAICGLVGGSSALYSRLVRPKPKRGRRAHRR